MFSCNIPVMDLRQTALNNLGSLEISDGMVKLKLGQVTTKREKFMKWGKDVGVF